MAFIFTAMVLKIGIKAMVMNMEMRSVDRKIIKDMRS
jgi:hypothetical protein